MARLYLLLFLIEVVLAIIALISCLSAEEGAVRGLPRIAWVIVILLFPLVGSTVYLIAGRPVSTTARPGLWRSGSGFPESTRPKPQRAPDDDPDFLRSLGTVNPAVPSGSQPTMRPPVENLRKTKDAAVPGDEHKQEKPTEEPPSADS